MHDFQFSEHYSDKQNFVVMTRTKVVEYAQLVRIADHLCRNAEDLVASTDAPCVDNCRIAGAMLGWAYNLAPLRIGEALISVKHKHISEWNKYSLRGEIDVRTCRSSLVLP